MASDTTGHNGLIYKKPQQPSPCGPEKQPPWMPGDFHHKGHQFTAVDTSCLLAEKSSSFHMEKTNSQHIYWSFPKAFTTNGAIIFAFRDFSCLSWYYLPVWARKPPTGTITRTSALRSSAGTIGPNCKP